MAFIFAIQQPFRQKKPFETLVVIHLLAYSFVLSSNIILESNSLIAYKRPWIISNDHCNADVKEGDGNVCGFNTLIQANAGSTLTLTCISFEDSKWTLPNNTVYEGYNDPEKDGRLTINKHIQDQKYKSIMTLKNLQYADTGF